MSQKSSLLRALIAVSSITVLFISFTDAGITSNFIRSEWPSVDMPLDDKVFDIPKGHNAPQQVRITQGDYNGKGVIISWLTPDESEPNSVQYGKSEDSYDSSAEGTIITYTFSTYKSGYIHHCFVTDLEYDTKYYYKIGDRKFWFRTPPKLGPDVPYTFGIIGDLGQTYNSLSTLKHYMDSEGQTVLFVGDLSYADRYEYGDVGIRWDSWGRFVEQSAAYQPWLWTIGNHEIEYMPKSGELTTFKSFLNRIETPYKACNSTNKMWYAVRRGPAHIIVLSNYSPYVKYTPQWRWLRDEFKRVDREVTPWLIVMMHVPMYNTNSAHYMEGESMRSVFESWFVAAKVDLVFSGHVHAYERSYRYSNVRFNVTGGLAPVPDQSAPVYITVGDGGNQEGLAGWYVDPQPEYSAFREASYGHSTLEIKNKTHAYYRWNRNDDGKKVEIDHTVFHNRYWANKPHTKRVKWNSWRDRIAADR